MDFLQEGTLRLDGAAEAVVGEHAGEVIHLAGRDQREDDAREAADERRGQAAAEEKQVPPRGEGGLQVGTDAAEHYRLAPLGRLAAASTCSIRVCRAVTCS